MATVRRNAYSGLHNQLKAGLAKAEQQTQPGPIAMNDRL